MFTLWKGCFLKRDNKGIIHAIVFNTLPHNLLQELDRNMVKSGNEIEIIYFEVLSFDHKMLLLYKHGHRRKHTESWSLMQFLQYLSQAIDIGCLTILPRLRMFLKFSLWDIVSIFSFHHAKFSNKSERANTILNQLVANRSTFGPCIVTMYEILQWFNNPKQN